MLDKKIKMISLLILSLLYALNISKLRSDNLNECIKKATFQWNMASKIMSDFLIDLDDVSTSDGDLSINLPS